MRRFFQWEFKRDSHGNRVFSRLQVGNLHLQIVHKSAKLDQAFHDHPYDWWEFPLTPYVEEVLTFGPPRNIVKQIVPALLPSFRYAEHKHRVCGRWNGRFSFFNSIYEAGAFGKPVEGEEPHPERGMIVILAYNFERRRGHGRYYMDTYETRYVETDSHDA